MKKENNKEGLYSPKGKVSLGQAVPMALQHVVAMVVGCISMPMLVAGAGGISGSEQIVMIQASLLGAAIAIFLQHYPLKGLVGSGLPVMIGSGFAFLPTLSSIVGQYGIAAMLGAQVFGAAMGIIVGVNLLDEEGKEYIEINVPPYPQAVSADCHRKRCCYHRYFAV